MRISQLKKEGEILCQSDERLEEVFHGLLNKFSSSFKTKEEKIKYVLRKCFSFMKKKLLVEFGYEAYSPTCKIKRETSDKLFFRHYFAPTVNDKKSEFVTQKEIKELKSLIMPFR